MPGICKSVTTTSNLLARQLDERFDRAGARGHVVLRLAQHVGHRFAGRGVVVDDQHAESIVVVSVCDSCGGSHRAAGNLDRERGAAFGAVHRRDRAAVGFGHVVHDRQAQAGAVLLGGVERLERAAFDFVAQARAAVGDFQLEATRRCRTT